MSNLSVETIAKPETDSEKNNIVDLFHTYCSHEFGSSTWHELLKMPEFSKMINHYQPLYGDAVFRVLADTVSEVHNIDIKDLLREFSNFINAYY